MQRAKIPSRIDSGVTLTDEMCSYSGPGQRRQYVRDGHHICRHGASTGTREVPGYCSGVRLPSHVRGKAVTNRASNRVWALAWCACSLAQYTKSISSPVLIVLSDHLSAVPLPVRASGVGFSSLTSLYAASRRSSYASSYTLTYRPQASSLN